ncbi:MAG: RdgB/HAM1 family non-canonical purine NTP pyrophosphatase [Alphaproteobacteria bacterium]|nr:RdgB/HAM1 family non-canonical purine NTP pyrophosphatase [Alphaproteobacteria bacterium]
MARQLTENRIVLASHNSGKVREIRELLAPFAVEVVSAGELDLPEPDETETTYKGNAILKAKAAALASGLPALSDDSGFELMAINKDPGIYSARWAGPDKDFGLAMEKVNTAFEASGSDDRHCRFICALSLVWPDGHDETVEGIIDGDFVWPPRGTNGFGYDPIFQLKGHEQTFGEVDPEWKDSVSHRAKAFAQLLDRCFRDTPKGS